MLFMSQKPDKSDCLFKRLHGKYNNNTWKVIQVRPIGKHIGEKDQDQHHSYYLFLTKTVDHISKYVFPSCYVIFTLIYVMIFFGDL